MTGSATPDSARTEIAENALKAGNPVKTSTGAAATASKPLYVDSSSKMASGSFPFALPVTLTDATLPIIDLTGVGTAGLLTTTFVKAADVSTHTVSGYLRIAITDTGDDVTDGSYYIPFGIIV